MSDESDQQRMLREQILRDEIRRELQSQAMERQVVANNSGLNISGFPPTNFSAANIQKLNGKNYLPWRRQVTIILKLRGLEGAIQDENVAETTDLQATLILLEAMDDSHKLQVQAEPTAKAIMANLDRQYANRSQATKHRMLTEFVTFKKDPADNISQHVGKLKEMRAALINLGEKHTEEFFQVILINSLSEEYGSFLEQWEIMHPTMKTTEVLINVYTQKEMSTKQDATALFTPAKTWDTMTTEEKMKISKCKVCLEKGHWARNCPKRKRIEHGKMTLEEETHSDSHACTVGGNEFAMKIIAGNQDGKLKSLWVADSAATSHMSRNKSWFLTLEKASGDVLTGDGTPLTIEGKGSIRILSSVNGKKVEGTLTKVLYVPQLTTNLISIGEAAAPGVKTTFEGKNCLMEKNARVIAEGERIDAKLYLMDIETPSSGDERAMVSTMNKTLLEYHKALGHANIERVKELLKQLGKTVPMGGEIDCPDCPGGKGKHVSHPRVGSKATEPGELHIDLATVNKASLEGEKYYLVCKDNFTEFTFVYPCRDKTLVPSLIAKLIIEFECTSGTRVREIHSDNGSELVNEATRLLFLKERIIHKRSAPFCPQQNGRVEREVQTITNMARTMLNSSKLEISLWAAAVECAAYIKNRLPTSSSNITPFEKLTGRPPKIDHIVEFGRQVHIIRNGNYLKRFDSRTIEGFVVGFTLRHNTYKVYVPERARIIETCDVIFAEHQSQSVENKQDQGEVIEVKFRSNLGTEELQREEDNMEPNNVEQIEETRIRQNDISPSTSTPRQVGKNGKPYVNREELSEFFNDFRQSDGETEKSSPSEYQTIASNETRRYIQTDLDTEQEEVVTETPTMTRYNIQNEKVLIAASKIQEPQNYRQASSGPNSEQWKEAIQSELWAHQENGTCVRDSDKSPASIDSARPLSRRATI